MENNSLAVNVVVGKMFDWRGQIVTISAMSGGQYRLEEAGGYCWTDGMFVGKVDDDNEREYKSFFDNQ